MDLRPLGATGIMVSPIGLGAVKLGRAEGVKYPRPFRIPDDAEAARLLALAQELGINLIDTAPAYGTSEERLGRLLAGQRDRWVIATKAGEEFTGGRSSFDFSPAALRASLERSLARLGTDHVDVCLLHSDGEIELDAGRFDDALNALKRLKAAGLARAVGASTKTPHGALRAVAASDVVMLTVNPDATGDLPALELAGARSVGVLAKKVLGSGRLAQRGGESASAIGAAGAIRFALSFAQVSCVVVGTIDPDHLRANVAAAKAAVGNG